MAEPLVVANPVPSLKLDLACGQSPREGFEGVDLLAPNAQHKVDLMKFPWPWADNSVLELHCSHFVEHIDCRTVEERDLVPPWGQDQIARFVGKDMLFAFFDECYRILVPGGHMQVIVPCGRSDRAFQDPTHRRFFVQATFAYLSKQWREANKLDHYRVQCDFGSNIGHSMDSALNALHPEVMSRKFNHEWNIVIDWIANLVAIK